MKSNKTNKQYPVAWPLALCYGLGVRLRNLCFGLGILPSETYPIAVISVGNLSAGGAGKTPLVEYLVRLLSPRYRVAGVSRGGRRETLFSQINGKLHGEVAACRVAQNDNV